MKEVLLARIRDPGRGPFCATTKQGLPLPLPPNKREPLRDRLNNPNAVHHPFKSAQDRMKVADRPRVVAADQRRARMSS